MAPNLSDTVNCLQMSSGWYHRLYMDEYFKTWIYCFFLQCLLNFYKVSMYGLPLAISLDIIDCILLVIQGKMVFLFKNRISAQIFHYFV